MPNIFILKERSRFVHVPWAVLVLTRPLFIVAVTLALLVSVGVAHAQGTPSVPTIESVAVTSDPGGDGGYAIGEEIQVGLTFSEAATVTGAPQLTLDVGGRNRTAEYSEGSATTQLLFTYTVSSGDEDTDGIAVVANSLALNGGAIRAGSANATLAHAALHSGDHRVDGIAPTVTVGGETRTYVPPGRQFNVVFYFSEKVYGITDAEITVTNGLAVDVQATGGNATWPKYTRWDVIIVPAAEGPVSVTLEAGAATDAYGNENTAPDSALEVIAATPVTVEVARTTSGFAEGGRAEFTVTRSGDNGAIPVFLSLDQTGDLLSGTVEVHPPADPNNPDEPVTPQEFAFTETPFNLNVTFAAGETSKRIAVLTEDDSRDEDDGTVTLSVPARPDQYKYIPGPASSATADVRDNDEPLSILLASDSYTPLSPLIEGEIAKYLLVHSRNPAVPAVYLEFTEGLELLDLGGAGSRGYEHVSDGRIRVELRGRYTRFSVPTLEDETIGPGGRIILVGQPGDGYLFKEDWIDVTYRLSDDDSPASVTLAAPEHVTEGDGVRYTITRTSDAGQSRAELTVNVELAQTGDYITWPTAHQPDADGLVTIPVNFAARSLTATLTLDTVDDQVSEDSGSVTATILADADGRYVTDADSGHTTRLLDNDLPVISVAAVSAEVTEGSDAQFTFNRMGNTSGATRVGLWVGGLPKIMTDASEAIALTADNPDLSQRLHIHGAWVDYILEFAAGEAEKTLSFTTEADNVNEGDGWFGVTIVQRAGNLFGIGTGYAQVLVKDDDIPTVSLTRPVGPTGLTLSADGTTWEGQIGEKTEFSYSSVCTGVTEFSEDQGTNLRPLGMWVMYANHPAHYGEGRQDRLGLNFANIRGVGAQNCAGDTVTAGTNQLYVGPENGVLEIELLPESELVARPSPSNTLHLKVFLEFIKKYEEAARAAEAAGTLITQKDIIHPRRLGFVHRGLYCAETDLRYCPKYLVGTVNKIRLTIINRDPTVLIKAENSQVEEGQPARFVVERLWSKDVIGNPAPDSTTVVSLRASQNGLYITGALPTEITFGRNETSKIIELPTVDDSAFGENGSVTIELLPDTTGAGVNLQGKYTTWEIWQGHTPEGARSDRATIAITNNDDKPGITIAPASALEGDSGSANMTFTVTLAKAVAEAVTVNYATSDGTAIAGRDYTAVSNGSVTIAAGATTAEFTVPVTGDETDELDETFNVTISLPLGATAAAITGGDTAAAVGAILDDDPAVVTVAPKKSPVTEGEEVVFVLTRTGVTDEELYMLVDVEDPARRRLMIAKFDADAVTTELSVATENNDLVDYPSERDYTIHLYGDGYFGGRDDERYTPGDPDEATITVQDNDTLVVVTVEPVKEVVGAGESVQFRFRRTGSIAGALTISFQGFEHPSSGDATFADASVTFLADNDTVVYTNDVTSSGTVNPISRAHTVLIYGDTGRGGLHRSWIAGDPNRATVVVAVDALGPMPVTASYPSRVAAAESVSVEYTVTNLGTRALLGYENRVSDGTRISTTPDRGNCDIRDEIPAGESRTCSASFTVTNQDVTNGKIEFNATARNLDKSSTLRVYIRVAQPVEFGFTTADTLEVTEGPNVTATLPVTRTGRLDEAVTVAYRLRPLGIRPAALGEDFTDPSSTPGLLTFPANVTSANIVINITQDQIDEERERFRVALVPLTDGTITEGKESRVVLVKDEHQGNDPYRPTASLQLVSSGPVPENEGPVEFAIVLDRVWGKDGRYEVEVLLDQTTATPGFATLGKEGDFEEPLIRILRIPAGQTRFEFSVPLYDDDVREEDETFLLQLTSPYDDSYRTIGTSNRALATIADDDRIPPTEVVLSLSHNGSALESVPEGSTQQDITVTASFPQIRWPGDASNAPLRPADPLDVDTTVRVRFDPNSGAAHAAGLDDFAPLKVEDDQRAFQEVESFDIAIPAGQTSGNATVRFWPVKDDVDEEDETVTLQGSEVVAGGSADSLPVRSASFTIIDDDTRSITVSPSSALIGLSLVEGGEPGTYSLVLDSQPTDTVVITLAGNQGGFLGLVPDTLTFTTSDWATPQAVSVMALDDGIAGGVPPTYFVIHQVSGGDYGSVTVPDISTLIEDTTQAFVYLEGGQASESDGYVEFTVTVRPILRTVPVLVRYATVDGTAMAGSDYTREVETGQTHKILDIPAGQSSGTIRIPITDDQVYESADETFTLQLTNHNNKATLDGGATSLTAAGAIADDDPKPVVSVAGPAGDMSYVSENAKDPVTFTLTLIGRSAGDVTVDYATGEAGLLGLLTARQGLAGATQDEDYAGTSGTVTFTPGQTTKTVTVQVTNDDVSEDTEFFGFRISAPQGADLTGQRSEDVADVGLLDDDPRGVAIGPTSISLDEPASGETAVAGAYTVKLSSSPTDTVTVTIGGSDPAVSLSGDTLTNNQLTFTTTNWNTAQTITVTPVKDDNAAGETVTLTHTLSGGDYAGIAADSVTVSLTDSDARNLVLSEESLAVTEGDATGVGYTVKLATQPSDTVTVAISGHDGADLTLSGTTLTNNQLTFTTTNWGTAQTVTVKAGDDDNADNESETLAHTASGGDYVNITKDLPVSITDDGVPVTFDPDTVTREVNENTGANQNVGAPVTATYTGTGTLTYTLGGTDAASFEIESSTGQIKTKSGVSYDHEAKATYTVTVTASDGNGGTATATVTINVNDVNEPPLAPTGLTATAVGHSRIYLSWTAPTDDDGSAITGYRIESSADGSTGWADLVADTGSDATTHSHTGLMPNTTRHYRVSAINGDGASDPSDTANATTVDYPRVTVSFGATAYTAAEGRTVDVAVSLDVDPERTVVIPITATPQGTTTTDDYTVPTSVTFDAGDMSKTITFTATQDTDDDDNESVKLTFGMLPSRVSAGTTAETTVNVTDDDNPPTASDGTVTTVEDTVYTFAAANFSYSDTDNDPLVSVKIIELPAAGTGALTLNGTAITSAVLPKTVTATELTGGGLKYAPPANANGAGYASFKFKVNDGTADSAAEYTITINVTAVNDPATGTPTISGTAQVGQMLTASTGDIADADGLPSAFTYQWKRYAADRTTFEANIGTDSMTYTLTASEEGRKVLVEVSFTDNGGSSEGPLVSALYPSTQSQTVDPNNPPTASDGTVTTVEDTDHTFMAANFSYADTDNDPLVSVKIIELPAAGALTLNGTAITSAVLPKTVTATELTGGGLKYAPPANANGAGYASFKFKVNDGTEDSASEYFMTINVTPVNDPATGTPTISGTAQVGQTLTASTGDIADADGLPSAFTYQWKRYAADRTTFEANIGTDSMTYTLTASEEGKKVLVEVSFTDNGGSSEGPLVSALYPSTQSQTVDPNNPPTAANGTVTTVEDTNYTFAAANFSYSDTDSDPLASVKIIELPAAGTGALTLNGTAIPSADLPKTVTATELTVGGLKYTPPANANGTGYASFKFKLNDGTEDSASEYFMTINVTPVNDPATGTPTISGTAQVGQTLTASTGDIADADGLPSAFTYQWKRYAADRTTFEANIGTDSMTYTLTAREEGKKVLVEVSFTDNGGSSEGPLVSALYPSTQSQTVDPNNPPTASDGTVTTVEDTAYTFAAANFNYADTDNDPLVSVKIIELPATGALTLNGTAIPSADRPQTVTAAEVTGGGLKYTPPANANGTGYAGFKFKLNDGTADSASEYFMTINVTPVNDPATGAPAISGTAHVGLTLTASTAGIADLDGVSNSFTYQWIRVDDDGTSNAANIGADSSAYTLTAAEEGKKVLVEVSFTDNGGSSEGPLASAAYPSSGTVVNLTVSFGETTYMVTENGTISVIVHLSADPERTVAIPITATPQGTTTTDDYTVPTSVTFDAGDMSQTITFTATQDAEDDDGESVLLAFGILPDGVSPGTRNETTVSITDDDVPQVTVSFGQAAYTVAEGETQSVAVTLSADPERTVVIPITHTPQTGADSPADYTVPSSVTFNTGQMSQTITFEAIQDDVDDDDESVRLRFGTLPPSVSLGTTTQATVSITDDDGAGVSVSESSLTIAEGSSGTYTIVLDSQPTADVTVTINDPSNADVTAEPASLTFSSTDWNTPMTVTVNAGQDADAEDETATVTHTVTSTDSIYSGASANSVAVTVTDDEVPVTVSFGATTYEVVEGETVTVTVILSADPERTVVIPITAADQDGAAPADYTVPTSVTVDAGEMSKTIAFTATQDNVDDDGESVLLGFGAPLPGGVSLGTTVTATVSITDDDGAGVSVSESSLTIAEGSSGTYTIVLDSQPTADVTVTINDPSNADVTAEPASLTFSSTDWNTPMTVTVNAGQDADAEDETATVTHTVTSTDSIYSGASANSVAVTVTDDEVPVTVSFGATTYEVVEGETVTVTVILSADPERTVVIPITAADQDGAAPADYTVPTSVTVDAGEMSKTIAFTATQDNVDDDGESVLLGFGAPLPGGVSLGTTNQATVSITDDDTPPTASDGTVTTVEDTAHTFAAANFSYSDTDNDPLVSVKIIELPAAGTGALTLNGTAIPSADLPKTVTATELTVGGLKYTPPANANGTGYASFKFKVNDGTADSAAEYTITINVTPVNDPATGTPTISGTAQVGQTLTASTGDIADADGLPSAFTYQWKRYAADRTTFEANIGTDSMTYTLTAREEGKKVLVEVSFTDNGGSSEGPLVSALYPSTQSQTVDPNNPPTASDGTVTTVEDTAYTFAAANFNYADTDNDPLVSVKIIELPATGALTLNGTAIPSADRPQTVTAAEVTGGGLKYTPPANANGTGYAGFKFKLNDGTADSASEYFMTINVTPVNDPATGAPAISGTAHVGLTLTASTAGIADLDGVSNSFTYQWIRVDDDGTSNAANIGADSSAYTLTAAEEGKKVLVEVSFTDNGGSSEGPLASAAYPSSGTVVNLTVSFGETTYMVTENGTISVIVHLSADPERTVAIPITATPQGTTTTDDYTVPTSVTFDAGDMSQTITFTATQDAVDDDGESVLLGFGAPLPGGVSPGTTVTATVSITDDDGAGVSVSESSLTIGEGSSGRYTIVLDSQPTASVAVAINDPSNTDVTTEPASLTFSSTDWSTPKTVTVNAAQDADAEDETVTVTHTVTSTDSSYSGVSANSVAVMVTDDDDPAVAVQFGATTYEVVEGETVTVTVTLSADPERTVVIPITHAPQSGADSPADYTVPTSVTFNTGQMSQTIAFTAAQDEVDDDGESVLLAIGTTLPSRVTQGATNETTVSITDDDDPQVAVSFDRASYRVLEGDTTTVGVTLSGDPERTVVIPLVATEEGGASSEDYSGVPSSVTINEGETSKTFEFMAMADDASDAGEGVMIGFGTSLPSRVAEGTPNEARVAINQRSTQLGSGAAVSFELDCLLPAAVWCADLGFSDRTAENWGWAYLRYGEGWDPPASLSDEGFRFRGVNYTVRTMELRPGTHPSMPNAWSRWQQGYSHFSIGIFWNHAWGSPSREHYQDWVLHLDGLELPFKEALRHGASFIWVGAEIQEVFNDWTPSTVNMIGIEEVAAADQETNPLLPWAPMQVDAPPQGPNRLLVVWAKPAWYFTGLPAPTKYIVQWKLASASWDNSAGVSEREVAAGSNFHSLTIDGLTEDALYSVRVIAGNDAGNGPPSEETLGRPQDDSPQLIAQTINGDRLTLRFSNRLSTGSVPAGTAFTVLADGGLIEVDSVAIRGNEVVLTLDRAVTAAAHSVKVRYDKPTDPSGVFLRDIGGNHAQIRQHHELLEVVNITPEVSVQPLTARFANEPANHNGRDNFTFDIEFSEPVWVAIGFPRDDMLEVAGGTVVSAPWRERRSDAITFHVRPDTMGDIVIVLPGNQVCEGIIEHTDRRIEPVAGAPCAIGNRKLTNSLTMTVPGPLSTAHQVLENTPAQGQPLIEGIPEPGQTLSANTNTITDADGLENTVFRYQWLADDAESNGATGATYTVESGDVSRAIRVRVTFTDDAGHEETLTSAPTVVTAAGLQLGSAAVDGATMKLTYNEELDTGVTLSTTAFAVEVNGSSRSLIGVGVGQSNVLLLLNPAVEAGDTVTVDYTAPDGPDFIRDTRGRKAASFSGQAVTNETASAPLAASVHNVPPSHNGEDAFTFELRFSEDPQPDFSYTTVRDHVFTVTGGSVTYVRRLEPGRNVRWEVTVTPGSGADVALALNATTDCSAQGAICTEDGRMLSGGLQLAVPGPNTPATETPNTPATGLPSITGTAQVGYTITAVTSGIEDADGLDNATFNHQWLADDAEIVGATGGSYILADADEGKTIKVQVSFTDDGDNDEILTSVATAAVAPKPNSPATGAPTISGTTQAGETLTSSITGISDGDGLATATFNYQWLADDADIAGATGSSYTTVAADEGKAIKVRVSFTDDAGNDEQLTSAGTGAVAAAPPPPNTPATGLPSISGTAQVGETLTAGTTGISDADGLGNAAFAYQWLADDAEINGATGSTYTLADADAGKAVKVKVTFTDAADNDEELTSAARARWRRLPLLPTPRPPGCPASAARPRWERP